MSEIKTGNDFMKKLAQIQLDDEAVVKLYCEDVSKEFLIENPVTAEMAIQALVVLSEKSVKKNHKWYKLLVDVYDATKNTRDYHFRAGIRFEMLKEMVEEVKV